MFNDDMDERREMVKYFVADSRELLDDVEPQIIAMEEKALSLGEVDQEVLNTVFRLFHSLKGSASFLDLQTITSVTHEAETLLDLFRKGETVISPEHVDLLIRTSDFIRKILDTVERQLNDRGYETDAGELLEDLQKSITSISGGEKSFNGMPSAGPQEALDGPEGDLETADSDDLQLEITPELTLRFVTEANDLLDETEKMLLALEKASDNLEYAGQAFRALHSFKGNAGFFGYRDLENLSHHAETLLDRIRAGEKICDPVATSFLLIAVDALRDGVAQIENGEVLNIPAQEEIIEQLNKLAGDTDTNEKGELNSSEEPNKHEPKPAEGYLDEKSGTTGTFGGSTRRENGGSVPRTGEERYVRELKKMTGQQAIRVDLEKLDMLLDLVGELVIAEAMVTNNQELKKLQLSRFEKAVLHLNKITRDIQEVAMSMRMVPLAGTFRRMVRLVRDLAQKGNKKVNLEIIGEETEVDKTIIEQISDPLVHLIRNAVDHGVETPQERKMLGKPETARLTVAAKHSAGEVWIIVEDDGRGLDREKILRKGMERGLIENDNLDLKDEEVWGLIFEPGFSTADKISSVSGRGVGMDVVKRNIEKLGGKVDIRSKTGTGTMFVIRIPLTLAIIEGMVVKVGDSRYTIPISSIKESFQPSEDQITVTPGALEVVTIRGELLPVIRLHELYKVQPICKDLSGGILIVVENDNKKCCLFVDELVGQQQIVIKGLSSYLGRVRSISGCAILGDGDVSMILDIADLINLAEERGQYL